MEKFYRKKMPWNPDDALEIVNASLDPLNQQSKYTEAILSYSATGLQTTKNM